MPGIIVLIFLDVRLVELRYSTVLHLMDWRVHFRFYRRAISLLWNWRSLIQNISMFLSGFSFLLWVLFFDVSLCWPLVSKQCNDFAVLVYLAPTKRKIFFSCQSVNTFFTFGFI